MPSSYSTRFRWTLQASGENLNTWGQILNSGVFQLIEDALGKRVAFSLSGAKTLTTANGASDEARCAFLDITGGTGGTITAPSVEKWYLVRNNASGDVILTTGAGSTATVKPGEVGIAVGDASSFQRVQLTDFGGARITSIGDPVNPQDAASRAYVDAQAFNAVNLPAQSGNAGKFIKTDGTTASWQTPNGSDLGTLVVADIDDYVADQDRRALDLMYFGRTHRR